MSERYSRLFTLTDAVLYTDGSPVILMAGALLKDNKTAGVLAQLKFKQMKPTSIKAIKVSIDCFDAAGKPLGDPIFFSYLDLDTKQNDEFGQKTPIPLPDPLTRAFTATVSEVVLADGTVWENSAPFTPLPMPVEFAAEYGEELLSEYHRQYGKCAKYLYAEIADLWSCVCGALNHNGEEKCTSCGAEHTALLGFGIDALRASAEQHLAEEKARAAREAARKAEEARAAELVRAAEERARAEEQAKNKNRAILITAIFLICTLILGITAYYFASIPTRVAEEAALFAQDGDYVSAVRRLDELNRPEKTAADRARYVEIMNEQITDAIRDRNIADAVRLIDLYADFVPDTDNLAAAQAACRHTLEITTQKINTCTENGYKQMVCSVCRYEEETLLRAPGHKKVLISETASTCTAAGSYVYRCQACGEKFTETLELIPHTYIKEITRNATCTQPGEQALICTVCGDKITKEIEVIAHSFKETVIRDATCTATGAKQQICTVCGKKEAETPIAMIAHSYKDTVIRAATCTTPGAKQQVCSACGKKEAETPIAVIAHSYKTETLAATCTENGYKQQVCSVCGLHEAKSPLYALGHSYTRSVKQQPTCTAAGVAQHTCSQCRDQYTEPIAATGHSWVEATCTEPKTCRSCALTDGSALGHQFDDTITIPEEKILCERCFRKDFSNWEGSHVPAAELANLTVTYSLPQNYITKNGNHFHFKEFTYTVYATKKRNAEMRFALDIEVKVVREIINEFKSYYGSSEYFIINLYDHTGKLLDSLRNGISEPSTRGTTEYTMGLGVSAHFDTIGYDMLLPNGTYHIEIVPVPPS